MGTLYSNRGNLAIGFHGCKKGYCDVMPYDSVRGCFMEGAKIQDMEIFEETHIQIAIRNLNCIKGIFLPRVDVIFPE